MRNKLNRGEEWTRQTWLHGQFYFLLLILIFYSLTYLKWFSEVGIVMYVKMSDILPNTLKALNPSSLFNFFNYSGKYWLIEDLCYRSLTNAKKTKPTGQLVWFV